MSEVPLYESCPWEWIGGNHPERNPVCFDKSRDQKHAQFPPLGLRGPCNQPSVLLSAVLRVHDLLRGVTPLPAGGESRHGFERGSVEAIRCD